LTNILLTGGTGFFGKSLLRYIAEDLDRLSGLGHVYVISRNPEIFLKNEPTFFSFPFVSFIQGDILDPASLPHNLEADVLIHAAADSTLGPKLRPLERFDQIVSGTRNMLDYAVKNGVKRFLFTSSGAVYGHISSSGASENSHVAPRTGYGVAKITAEHLCDLFRQEYGLETVVARCFAFVGPDLPLDVHFAIGNFIRDALWGNEIVVLGDGRAVRSYLCQSDLARWLIKLAQSGLPGATYNVGSDEIVTIAELAYLVRDILAPNKPVRILGRIPSSSDGDVYFPNIEKITHLNDLKALVSLRDAIKITAQKLGTGKSAGS